MIDIKLLGQNIRNTRKQKLLTIEALAEKAKITDNFLGKIERGESKASLETISSIASALDVSIDSLIRDESNTNKEISYISSLMSLNNLSEDNKEQFISFIRENIKYFK